MKYFIATLFFFSSLFTFSQKNIVEDELLVMVSPKTDIYECIEKIAQNYPAWNFEHRQTLSKRLNIHQLSFSSSSSVNEAVQMWNEFPFTLIAQANHTDVAPRDTTPNDPSYTAQWAHGKIQSEWAWERTTGGVTARGDTIVAAVIDGGADLTHQDLDYFVNRHEIPNNGIDDDQNGYVDDVSGWNAYNNNGAVPSDYHGTHVSGIIGAKGNNNEGVAGVNWSVKILPIAGSSGQESRVISAYAYALEMRAQYEETDGEKGAYVVVTNSSFGVNLGNPSDYPLWCAFYDSLGAYGILSAGATANADFDIDVDFDIPTACESDYLISVTNTTSGDFKNAGAAYGQTTIDIGAPGTGILSTATNGGYQNSTGTSMATPMVAGAIALMYSYACDQVFDFYEGNPQGLALKMKEVLLEDGVDTLSQLKSLTVSGGRLNTFKAIYALDKVCQLASNEKKITEINSLKVYPNPSKGTINLIAEPNSVIHITNMLGETIYLYEMERTFKAISLSPGFYIVSSLFDEEISTQKIIVQ